MQVPLPVQRVNPPRFMSMIMSMMTSEMIFKRIIGINVLSTGICTSAGGAVSMMVMVMPTPPNEVRKAEETEYDDDRGSYGLQ